MRFVFWGNYDLIEFFYGEGSGLSISIFLELDLKNENRLDCLSF